MSRNMTIPSRPAPPPPQAASNKTTRYSPATNWDDTPFSPAPTGFGAVNSRSAPPLTGNQLSMKPKKAPPPRPPPPKVVPALKKPGQPQSINILSNLFGQKRNHPSKGIANAAQKGQVPMKLPPPPKQPPPLHQHTNGHYGSTGSTPSGSAPSNSATGVEFLISFDSPPSSPTFTQKSCSDCISVDSFSSDSNYSSPNNGSMSQAESGFEDDFVSQHEHQRSKATTPASSTAATPASTSALKDLWDLSDTFGMPPPGAATSTSNTSNIYAPLSSATIRAPAVNSKLYASEFVDPLCNGKSVAPKVQTVAMPTIIKPGAGGSSSGANSQKSTPVHLSLKPKPAGHWAAATAKPPAPLPPMEDGFVDDGEESLDSLPSPPMPNIPPPPPPPCVADPSSEDLGTNLAEPYGIAMYDFSGETDEDLSFRTNEKIYLLKRLNEEWLLGRDRRGCEGMFPANYIEVKVPLREGRLPSTTANNNSKNSISSSSNQSAINCGDISHSGTDSFRNHPKVRVLYTFNAEAPEDLTIVENQHVTVLGQITSEWLYGDMHGRRGQFPANFIEYVPANLPPVAAASGGV